MDRLGLTFCIVSLAIAIVVGVVGFQFAARSPAAVLAAKTPVPPESMPDIDLPGFGKVAVLDMMLYYIENPPVAASDTGEVPATAKRFGGC